MSARLGLAAIVILALAGGHGIRAEDAVLELGPPLTFEERASVAALERALGSPDPAERDRAAQLVREGPGVRAARLLLDLAGTEPDAEARFRARALVQSLLMRHFLAKPCGPAWLGVAYTPASTARHPVAILANDVIKGGPAFRAGLVDGDLIVLFDGKPFRDGHDLRDVVHGIPPGTDVAVTVERGGEDVVFHVVLGSLKDGKGLPVPPERDRQRDIARWRFRAWQASREITAGAATGR